MGSENPLFQMKRRCNESRARANSVKTEIAYLRSTLELLEGVALFGRLTGYTPRSFSCFIGDGHVYDKPLDLLNEQVSIRHNAQRRQSTTIATPQMGPSPRQLLDPTQCPWLRPT